MRKEYGGDRVAQIITFGKLQARAAVRDVGRVLGMPYGQVNRVAELIPNNPAKPVTLQQAVDGEPRLQAMRDDDEGIARLLEIALQVEGLYRHASTHAAGVVIGDRPLIELVPLYRDPKSDFLVTQYSMKHVEQAGLVKFDFLGLTTLTILQRAEGLLHGLGIDIDLEPPAAGRRARPTRCWQRATPAGCSRWKARACATCCARCARTGSRTWSPPWRCIVPARWTASPNTAAASTAGCGRRRTPMIHDILAETYGIIVYQEQVMQIAQTMAGYSLGGADLLRRAMGKKIPAGDGGAAATSSWRARSIAASIRRRPPKSST